jgi:hypothetical protein
MKVTIALFALLACAYAMPAPQDVLLIPGADKHNDAVEAIKATQYALSQPILPEVPGLAEHQAAEALVLAGQGLNPGIIVQNGNEARVLQAEQQLIAIQQQQ